MSLPQYGELFDEFSDDDDVSSQVVPDNSKISSVTQQISDEQAAPHENIHVDSLFDMSDSDDNIATVADKAVDPSIAVQQVGDDVALAPAQLENLPPQSGSTRQHLSQQPIGAPRTVNLRRYPVFGADDQVILFSLPKLVGVDLDDYVRETFEPSNVCHTLDPLRTEATGGIDGIIRSRAVKHADGTTSRQSNSRLVRWKNGQVHLQVGRKFYEVRAAQVKDSTDFLFIQSQQGVHYHIGTVTHHYRVGSQQKDFGVDAVRLQVVQQRIKQRTQSIKAAGGNVRRIRIDQSRVDERQARSDLHLGAHDHEDDDDGEDLY